MKIRGQEQELRRVVHQARSESGLQALTELATIERDRALAQWRRASGEGLIKYQTQYNAMQAVIDFVLTAPQEFNVTVK